MNKEYEAIKYKLMEYNKWIGTEYEHYASLLYSVIFQAIEDNDLDFFVSNTYRHYCTLLKMPITVMDYVRNNLDHVSDVFKLLEQNESNN